MSSSIVTSEAIFNTIASETSTERLQRESLCSLSVVVSDSILFSIWDISCVREGSSTSPFKLFLPSVHSALSFALYL